MKLVKHEVTAWTVGQLRKALADFPDDVPVRVAPLEEPGGDLEAPLQVVTGTGGPALRRRRRRRGPARREPGYGGEVRDARVRLPVRGVRALALNGG